METGASVADATPGAPRAAPRVLKVPWGSARSAPQGGSDAAIPAAAAAAAAPVKEAGEDEEARRDMHAELHRTGSAAPTSRSARPSLPPLGLEVAVVELSVAGAPAAAALCQVTACCGRKLIRHPSGTLKREASK